MIIKYKKKLMEYNYLIMFDLASKTTGVCLYDIKNKKPITTDILKVKGELELPTAELKSLIDDYFQKIINMGISKNEMLVSFEAMPTQVHGGSSTIQTFLALAKAHATLDNYLYENNYDVYDYKGVYPITTHSYYKKLTNKENNYKVEKKDLKDYLIVLYHLKDNITLDETDSIFLALTLIEKKWNSDIDEEIRVKKKHIKQLKQIYSIDKIKEEIKYLNSLKI